MAHTGYRKLSLENWGCDEGVGLTVEQINCGALLRIADATEKMAQRHTELIDRANRLQRDYDRACERNARQERRIAALRGVITKMRKAKEGT